MKKRVLMLLSTIVLATLVLTACGTNKGNEKPNNDDNTILNGTNENNINNLPENDEPENEVLESETPEPEDNENDGVLGLLDGNENKENNNENNENNDDIIKNEDVEFSDEFSDLISYMEEETEGEANVIYETTEAEVYDLEDLSVSVDAYTVVELKDFHTNFSIPFNDQTDGGVIIIKYTVANDSDEDAYYAPNFYLDYTGATKAFGPTRNLIPDEDLMSNYLKSDDNYLLEAGNAVTGYYAYSFGQDFFDEALDVSTVVVEIPSGQAKEDSFDEPIGKDGTITLSLNEDGEERKAGNAAFYQDKVTKEDMGDKEIINEKSDINETQDLRDVKVTLEGYQFTDFTPNEVEEARFSNFTEGIVLLTVKFVIDNQGSENIGLNSLSSKLTVNDGGQWSLNEGMLLDYDNNDVIKAGESGELLQVFTLDKEQYDKIWKEKDFEVEVGPMKDEEAKDISKGSRIEFVLP